MTGDQILVFATLGVSLVLFIGGWWRYDMVALAALLAVTVGGIISPADAFLGFGHPAVVAVAAVLILSQGLRRSGIVDVIAGLLMKVGDGALMQLAALTSLVAVCSAFMNNIGALAVLMPVAIQMARKSGRPPSMLLMPLAFGSLLGGLVTLIGTPPNIIIATFRARTGEPFNMFDFTPVGSAVAVAGVAFIVLVGWRLIPRRQAAAAPGELFKIEDYLTELRVVEDSKLAGRFVRDLEEVADIEATVVGLLRSGHQICVPSPHEIIRSGDVLLVEADPKAIQALVDAAGVELVGDHEWRDELLKGKEMQVAEMIISPESTLIGRTVRQVNVRWRLGLNLLALARQGRSVRQRLKDIRFQAGDILLLQGPEESVGQAAGELGLLPLAQRGLRLGGPRRLVLCAGLFAAAMTVAATGLLPVHVAFVAAAVVMAAGRLIPLRELYESVDWPVIVLLGAMIPVGQAMEISGASQRIAGALLEVTASAPPWMALAAIMVVTMFLSDLMNNAATAVLMAPIALLMAQGLNVSADPFLMAVAVGASCAFLTPIGHQSNTLVMAPGGYRFSDYWRVGLPLEIVIVAVAIPMLLWTWPMSPAS